MSSLDKATEAIRRHVGLKPTTVNGSEVQPYPKPSKKVKEKRVSRVRDIDADKEEDGAVPEEPESTDAPEIKTGSYLEI